MLIVGIAGGTGSGKTTFAHALKEELQDNAVIISQDSYYHAHQDLSLAERRKKNFDHPAAFDNELLVSHLKDLRHGQAIAVPTYDFKEYTRAAETVAIEPRAVILV